MFERLFHLVLAIVMFVILLLPMGSGPSPPPNWILPLYICYDCRFAPGTNVLLSFVPHRLAALGVPILMVLNLPLAFFPRWGWKTLYRIALLVLVPMAWWLTANMDTSYMTGYWALPGIVTVAALFEVGFVVQALVKAWRERRRQRGAAS